MLSSSIWKPEGCAAMNAKRLEVETSLMPLDAFLWLLIWRLATWGLKPFAFVGKMQALIALLLKPVIGQRWPERGSWDHSGISCAGAAASVVSLGAMGFILAALFWACPQFVDP